MYTVKIDISDWGNDEFLTLETGDFDKVQIIQEFIEFQKEYGWAVDYEAVVHEDASEDEEDFSEEVDGIDEELVEDDEPVTVSTYIITKVEE
jgi:23S rRNA maturation-related 3'-5' exoribonuclease YhaM